MATINLAPANENTVAQDKRRRFLVVISGVVGVSLLITWVVLFILVKQIEQKNEKSQANLTSVETEIAKLSETAKRVVLFERRLQAMDSLLKTHVSWDPILKEIERLLPPTATLQQATLQLNEGTITVNGATPNLDELAQTLASLTSQVDRPTLFSKINLAHSERHEERVNNEVVGANYTFSLQMSFDPKELHQ